MGGAHVQRHVRHVVLWYAQEASLQLAGLGRQPGQRGMDVTKINTCSTITIRYMYM